MVIKQTLEEWRNEAIERFGESAREWAFQCPKCGNVQTALDFVEKSVMGLNDAANAVYQECIGRHVEGDGCNWAAYGLFGTFGKGRIVIAPDDGREVEVFDFATEQK
nr:VVA0879 family protein [Brevibacillus sp. HD1.4A]